MRGFSRVECTPAEPGQQAAQRIARIRTYFHTPEVVSELCGELDLPCRTSGYRFW